MHTIAMVIQYAIDGLNSDLTQEWDCLQMKSSE